MSFKPLKKIFLAAAVTLSCAFNTVAKAQAASPSATEQVQSPTSSLSMDTTVYMVRKAFNKKGVLVGIGRYNAAGYLTDGPNGEPAFQVFNKKGRVIEVMYCKNGLWNDGLNGEPAIQQLNCRGRLLEAVRCNYGIVTAVLSKDERDAYQEPRNAAAKKARAQEKPARQKRLFKNTPNH
jgi:hypothetical protein